MTIVHLYQTFQTYIFNIFFLLWMCHAPVGYMGLTLLWARSPIDISDRLKWMPSILVSYLHERWMLLSFWLNAYLFMHFFFRVIDSCLDIFKSTNNVQWSKLTTWLAVSQKVIFGESIEPSTHLLSVHVLPCVFLLPKPSKQDFCPPMVDKILKPLLAFSFNLVTLPSIN